MSSGLFFGINIALKGMMAHQTALSVVSHNIANANTDGYSKQMVHMATSYPIPGLYAGADLMGSGVEIAQILRLHEEFINYQIREENATKGLWEVFKDTMGDIEVVFMEPHETGFNEMLNRFFNDWQEVAKYAESSSVRTTLKDSAVYLAESFRNIVAQLSKIKEGLQTQINHKTKEVEILAQEIAQLNEQIASVWISQGNPNDFLDKRDLALDRLSQLGNISVHNCVDENGKITGAIEVKFGDQVIVAGRQVNWGALNDAVASVTDGEIAGLLKAGSDTDSTNTVQYYINRLNTLAVGLAKAVNDIHVTGKTASGSEGGTFFVFLDSDGNQIDLSAIDWTNPFASGLGAANIYVNPDIERDVSLIAAGREVEGLFLPGNGDVAREIARLIDIRFEYDEANNLLTRNPAIEEITIGDFYKNLIADLGSMTAEAERMYENQNALVNQLVYRRESKTGVSLDEEMVNLVQYQHGFQANARVISVLDEMLDTIINGLIR